MTTQVTFPAMPVAAGLVHGGFAGGVHLPGDAEYDAQRRPLIPTMDPRPLVVAEAVGKDDVRAAVLAARSYGLPFAVQATGHGTRVPSDGGVLLKTTGMTSVLVDPQRRIAKVGPGTRWGAVIDAAAPFGLAPLAGSSRDVGVTGYTLGGGVGWLSRKFGFAADSVLRAEVVTADGRVVTASPDEHPDLFWALRGGGGNFGVVTSLEFRLYPVQQVQAGIAYFGIERAEQTLAFYREWVGRIPNELSTAVLLTHFPPSPDVPEALRGRRALAIKALYAGAADLAEHLLRPLFEVAGPVRAGGLRTMNFAGSAMGGTAARYLDLVDAIPDDLIQGLTSLAETGPTATGPTATGPTATRPRATRAMASGPTATRPEATGDEPGPTVELRHWGGAMAHPGPDAGPVGHRAAPYSVIIDQEVPQLAKVLRTTGRTFLNFLGDPARTESAYEPEDYRRLREVKRAYDPENFFCRNHNIPPG